MSTPIIFPSTEKLVIDYLKPALAVNGYPGMSVVETRTTAAPQVWVRRDGGPVREHVLEVARVGVNVFGATPFATDELTRTVAALLRAWSDGTVKKVTQAVGPSPVADASGPRRFMSFELVVKGSELS